MIAKFALAMTMAGLTMGCRDCPSPKVETVVKTWSLETSEGTQKDSWVTVVTRPGQKCGMVMWQMDVTDDFYYFSDRTIPMTQGRELTFEGAVAKVESIC